ncbi:MAG: M3 family oligoendopeptidase [Caldilinea sp.]|jgi:oligoendopeptidase F|uniref:M3 family oligoendopeptidase n=1 Tax=Caldilinea sp. TaxID=2293560 RepID=UPI003098765D
MTITKNKYALSAWDLSELLAEPSEQEISARMAEVEEEVRAFEKLRDLLQAESLTADDVTEALRRYESILRKAWTLAYYAMLWFSADTQSTPAITLQNRMQQALTDIQNRLLFFELWWKGLDDARAAHLTPDAAVEPDYAFFLQDLRRTRPYTLDEKSEQIINLKDANGITGLMTVYSMLTNRLEFTLTVDGEERKLTRDALMSYVYSPDAQMRAAAYQELYRVYGDESKVLAQIYNNRVRDWWNEQVQLRGYASPIAVRNVANDVPDAAVETLLEVVARNAPVFQRYFKLKAKWLGMEKLRRYDIYAPLTASDRTIEYGDAVELVLDTFRRFDPDVAALVQRVFDQKHIDSEVRKGKRGGAFCATVRPDVTPYVLLNYTGKVRDVATLAHELGHALHSMLAAKHSILTHHPSLPLAETASVFAEMLLTDRLLAEERDPLVRRDLLASAVDDMYATVMRQTFFVLFEKAAHQAILENASQDRLNELYMENLRHQFGDSLEIAPEFQHEWVSIPHIYHTPFYCYAYSFGQLLVLALYRRYQQEGDAFKPGYLKLLAYGGAARPEQMLREAGVDIADPDFWQGGFDVIAGMIDELEAM